MRALQAIGVYLLSRQITTSQKMETWYAKLVELQSNHGEDFFRTAQYHECVRELHASGMISQAVATNLLQVTLWIDEGYFFLSELEKLGISVVAKFDKEYPEEFKEMSDKPAMFFCYGNKVLLGKEHKVTLVGTREPSEWGSLKAKQYAYEASACGVVTVSGLAVGVDTITYEETLKRKGAHIAVIPQLTRKLLRRIDSSSNFLVLSEFPPSEMQISKWQFVARNRLLAALGEETVVIEAPLRSGTLITADLALSYGKSVFVTIADPNQENSYGGIAFALQQSQGVFIQSLYDIFYLSGKESLMEQFKEFIARLSAGKLLIPSSDCRHLADADVKRYIWASSGKQIEVFNEYMVELHRIGIIKERKGKVVFNFSGYASWPKI